MGRKILCYDLHGADSDDYQDVYDYIENTLKGYRATESVYVFNSNLKNSELCDDFKLRFGDDVSLVVGDLPAGVSTNKIDTFSKWKA